MELFPTIEKKMSFYNIMGCAEGVQQIKDVKTKIDESLLNEAEKINTSVKQNYDEAGSRATKFLARQIRRQQINNNIHKITIQMS